MLELQELISEIERLKASSTIYNYLYLTLIAGTIVAQGIAIFNEKKISKLQQEVGIIKDDQAKRNSDEKDDKIRQTNKELEDQKEATAKAQKDAAHALRQANESEIRRLELKEQLQPRRFINTDARGLSFILQHFKGETVKVESYMLDVESAIFSDQIVRILKNAGINVIDAKLTRGAMGSIFAGILIDSNNSALSSMLDHEFNRLKISTSIGRLPPQNGITVDSGNAQTTIFVGVKPIDKKLFE